jgi:hypothetical protein
MRVSWFELLMMTLGLSLLGLFVIHGQPLDALVGGTLMGLALVNLELRPRVGQTWMRWRQSFTTFAIRTRRPVRLVRGLLARSSSQA